MEKLLSNTTQEKASKYVLLKLHCTLKYFNILNDYNILKVLGLYISVDITFIYIWTLYLFM